jgi:hypothetical protein
MASTTTNQRYAIEPELIGPTPRRAGLTRNARFVRAVLPSLIALAVCGISLWGVSNIQGLRNLQTQGVAVQGRITSHAKDVGGRASQSLLAYSYTVGGRTYRDRESVTGAAYQTTRDGDPVALTYLPSDPADNIVGSVTDSMIDQARDLWAVLTGLVAGFLIILTWNHERTIRYHLRLMRDGDVVPAVVAEKQVKVQVLDGRRPIPSYVVTCNFWADLRPISRQFPVPQSLYDAVSPGMALTVLCNPLRAEDSLPYRAFDDVMILPSHS